MRSTEERIKLLSDSWQKKLNLKEYVNAKYEETLAETPLLDGETGVDKARRQLFYLNMLWFMTNLLDRKDRMSMGASLEVRVPFADHRLVEYVWNIPWEMKMHDNREKGILRKALEGILPDDILYRKKARIRNTSSGIYKRRQRMAENDQKPKGLRAPYLAGQKTIRSAFRNGRLLLQGAVVRAAHEGASADRPSCSNSYMV